MTAKGITVGVAALGLVAAFGASAIYTLGTKDTAEFTVKNKERVTQGQSSKYLVYTDKGVYENTDSLLNMKFNSSDVYNNLDVGKSYKCDVYGWRVPFMSMYQNIVRCTPKP